MISIVAHRGYAAEHPENTMAAVQAAADAGIRWIEIDVQLRDGELVLSHGVDFTGEEPPLAEFSAWLVEHPQITGLVDLKGESLVEHGREQVVFSCLEVMRGSWHPVSFDYAALALAVKLGSRDPGWVVCKFDPEIEAAARALRVRWLIINQLFLPPGPVPQGPWDWMAYEIATADQARDMISRGVCWIESMAIERIQRGLEIP